MNYCVYDGLPNSLMRIFQPTKPSRRPYFDTGHDLCNCCDGSVYQFIALAFHGYLLSSMVSLRIFLARLVSSHFYCAFSWNYRARDRMQQKRAHNAWLPAPKI